jgi:hypothetical protein
MNDPGRPTLYRPDYCELARNYCLLGATNEDLGSFFDVTSRTIDNWIAVIPNLPRRCAREGRSPTPGWRAASTSASWAMNKRSNVPSGTSARSARSATRATILSARYSSLHLLAAQSPATALERPDRGAGGRFGRVACCPRCGRRTGAPGGFLMVSRRQPSVAKDSPNCAQISVDSGT